ncbi:phospholipid phosphatase 2 isoform X2 [Plutella xylostella]|uniref:phospholipid phosphatase 2 isoform X2 n=1 Tax=Plutella xylostella TaxID=51655 RepID=UPI00203226C3|nr:phospholipid phosphatase 2 isoform X2 [Plutella xylostella]
MVVDNILRSSVVSIKRIASLPRYRTRADLESQSTVTNTKSSPGCRLCWRLCIDVPIVVLVLGLVGLYEARVIPSYKAGFFCNDPALSYPFKGDTVTAEVLIPSLLIGPLVFIFVTELFIKSDYTFRGRLKRSLQGTAWVYRCFLYGLVFNFVLVELIKGISGRGRPSFFDVCKPDTALTCNGTEWVSTFECTAEWSSSYRQFDSYHSFPSGHTSLSVHAGFFVAWYLQRRAFSWKNTSFFLVPFLQLCCMVYAAVCSLSRITDNQHHWWDVLVGAVIGVATMCYSAFVLLNNLKTKSSEDCRNSRKSNLPKCLIDDSRFATA